MKLLISTHHKHMHHLYMNSYISYPATCENNSTRKLLVKNGELVWHSKLLRAAPHVLTERQRLCVSILRNTLRCRVMPLILELGLSVNFLNVVMVTEAQPTPCLVETD